MPRYLTLAYMTARKEPRIEWFLDSLHKQLTDDPTVSDLVINIFVTTFHSIQWMIVDFPERSRTLFIRPKPSVWQGPSRLTKVDWFAASNARNTPLCMAPDGWIAYVDDLSVLMPGWLKSVREAMAGNYIACGAYRKVNKLFVENGEVKSFEPVVNDKGEIIGEDNRLKHVTQDVTQCGGNWLYGCSLVAPVEALLSVNGWPEDLCDGHGFEDVCMGIVLKNAGYDIRYDRRMMTYESEEDHHKEPAFTRKDFHFENGEAVEGGNGKTDKSHAALNIALASKHFPNSFGEGGIRALRQKILAGESFPIPTSPQNEWYTGKLLSEL